MKLLKDIDGVFDNIEALYEVLDKNFTSNPFWIIDTSRGLQYAIMIAGDEQAANEGVSGMVKASLVATSAKSVICHQPIGIPSLEEKKSPNHFNWTFACHLKHGKINRYVLGECVSNPESQEFKTTIIQELDQASGYDDLSFLPLVFHGLGDFLCVEEQSEIIRARKFLEESRPDLDWDWSDYDN